MPVKIIDKNNFPKVVESLKSTQGTVEAGVLASAGSSLLTIANANEFGAEISPKNSKWLTIPLRDELKGKSARDFSLQFVHPKGKGYALLVQRNGSEIVPFYLLVKHITIPERAFIRGTFDRSSTIDRLVKIAEKLIDRALNGKSVLVLDAIGEEFVSMVKERINNGDFKKNSPITVNMKGGSIPLYDTGALRDHITYQVKR